MCKLSVYIHNQTDDAPPRRYFVRVTPHPRSGLPSRDSDLETAKPSRIWLNNDRPEPWSPFATENDFKFAEHITHMNMSNGDLDWFLRSIQDGTISDRSNLSFNTANDLREVVDDAASIYQSVSDLASQN
jgi:hypothetical protein